MITIVAYNPDWPGEYARLAGPLHEALGALALRIDHIGSTAVPGLAAKDVIDMPPATAPPRAGAGAGIPLSSTASSSRQLAATEIRY